MPLTTWVTDADLTETLANAIGQTTADLADATRWAGIITRANTDAYYFILRKCMQRGYTKAEIDSWPERVSFNMDIGLYYALYHGGVLSTFSDTFIRAIDRRKELDEALLFDAAGNPIYPSGAGVESSAGATEWTSEDEFSPNMDFTFTPGMRNYPRQGGVRDMP